MFNFDNKFSYIQKNNSIEIVLLFGVLRDTLIKKKWRES